MADESTPNEGYQLRPELRTKALRAALEDPELVKLTDSQLARRFGVAVSTVGVYRKKDPKYQIDLREAANGKMVSANSAGYANRKTADDAEPVPIAIPVTHEDVTKFRESTWYMSRNEKKRAITDVVIAEMNNGEWVHKLAEKYKVNQLALRRWLKERENELAESVLADPNSCPDSLLMARKILTAKRDVRLPELVALEERVNLMRIVKHKCPTVDTSQRLHEIFEQCVAAAIAADRAARNADNTTEPDIANWPTPVAAPAPPPRPVHPYLRQVMGPDWNPDKPPEPE